MIALNIQTEDREAEVLLQFIKTRFSEADVWAQADIVRRALKWLEMEKDGAPGNDPSTGRLQVLCDLVQAS